MVYTHNNGKEFDLTKVQIRLIQNMQDGWVVQESNEPSDKRCWMTRNGLEFTVHAPTIRALEDRDIIQQDGVKPVGTYDFVE